MTQRTRVDFASQRAARVCTSSRMRRGAMARQACGLTTGLLTVFIQHTSASLTDSGECRSRT